MSQPDWYNDLDGTLKNAFEELSNAVDERGHGFRTFALATIDLDGFPRSRIVVLRSVDRVAWQIRFHSDLRSDKIAELEQTPNVSLLFYDKQRKLQVRLRGRARVHTVDGDSPEDGVAADAFKGSQPMSRVCYRVEPGPGTVLENPGGYDHAEVEKSDDGDLWSDPGAAHFTAITVECEEAEILYLAGKGHRRSRFRRGEDGGFKGEWLTP